jgi:hypothetical protein
MYKLLFVLSIVCVILGVSSFWLGFHHVDLSWNMGRNAIDIGIDNKPSTVIQIYNNGWRQVVLGFCSIVLGFVLLLVTKIERLSKCDYRDKSHR